MSEPKRLWVEIDLEYPDFGGNAYTELTSIDEDTEGENESRRYLYIAATALRELCEGWEQRGYTAGDCIDQLEALLEGNEA